MKGQDLHNENELYLAQWLDGRLSDDELEKRVSKDDFLIYLKIREGLKVHEELERPLDTSFQKIRHRIEFSNKKKVRRLYTTWAASVAAVFVLFFGLYSLLSSDSTIVQTQIAEQTKLELPDGSEVVVNAHSKVSFEKKDWETHRSVYLDGEAFFKVEKGSSFTVITENGNVEVLGTQFTVNSNLDLFEITCYEGRVKVTPEGNGDYILTTGNAFRRINGHPHEAWEFAKNSPSWMEGESSFKSVPLKYVLSTFEKQYDLKFNSDNIDVSLLFTGSFGHNDIEIALASVFKAMQIQYATDNDGVMVLGNY